MELSLPMNYVELEQEEMMYLDGGWSINQVVRNCVGLASVAGLAWVADSIKTVARENPELNFWGLTGKVSVTAAKAFWALPWWAKVAGLGAGAATIWAMGEYDLW